MVHEFCRAVCDAAVIVTHHASGVGHMTACRTVGEADGGASARRRVSVRAQRAPAFDKLRARAVSLSNRTPKSRFFVVRPHYLFSSCPAAVYPGVRHYVAVFAANKET